MTEKIETKRNQAIKRGAVPKRRNPPIFPMNIAIGITKSDEIMIVDLMDSQSSEANVASFSFILTRNKAEQLKRGIEKFLSESEQEDGKDN